jgi:hypothetical protein
METYTVKSAKYFTHSDYFPSLRVALLYACIIFYRLQIKKYANKPTSFTSSLNLNINVYILIMHRLGVMIYELTSQSCLVC